MSKTLENQHFVAHIDILGMSALVGKDPELAWQLLSSLVKARKKAHATIRTIRATAERIEPDKQIQAVTFSDTILLFTQGEKDNDLRALIMMSTDFLSVALNLCVPIRIGISVGTFFFNLEESMYAGPALIEAYHLGEKAQWIGITTSEEVYHRSIKAKLSSGLSHGVICTKIPHRDGLKEGYAVNWPISLRDSINTSFPVTAEEIYEGFEQYFGSWASIPPAAQLKYENTARFMNEFGEKPTRVKNST